MHAIGDWMIAGFAVSLIVETWWLRRKVKRLELENRNLIGRAREQLARDTDRVIYRH